MAKKEVIEISVRMTKNIKNVINILVRITKNFHG